MVATEIPLLVAWVGAGSALGGTARFLCSGLIARAVGETFPWGTLAVNVSGSLAIGVAAGLAQHHALFGWPEGWHAAVTGFLGSYTTVSSFSLQTLALVNDGEGRQALRNVLWSLMGCLSAVAIGYAAVALGQPAGPA